MGNQAVTSLPRHCLLPPPSESHPLPTAVYASHCLGPAFQNLMVSPFFEWTLPAQPAAHHAIRLGHLLPLKCMLGLTLIPSGSFSKSFCAGLCHLGVLGHPLSDTRQSYKATSILQ